MRISDWSSDVCSSDLTAFNATEPLLEPTYKAQEQPREMVLHNDDRLNDKPVATIEPDTMARMERIRRNTRESIIRENAADGIEEIYDAFQRTEEHTSELQSLMRISSAVFTLKTK